MPTLTEGMVQLNVPIPEELRDLLDQEIIERCGYPKRGILGEVVTAALREYLFKRHAHTHTDTQKQHDVSQKKVEGLSKSSESTNRYDARYRFLCETIKNYGNENNYRITPLQITDFIKQIIGRDKRTIKRYIELLEDDVIICPTEDAGKYSTPKPLREIEVKE